MEVPSRVGVTRGGSNVTQGWKYQGWAVLPLTRCNELLNKFFQVCNVSCILGFYRVGGRRVGGGGGVGGVEEWNGGECITKVYHVQCSGEKGIGGASGYGYSLYARYFTNRKSMKNFVV